jgi:hypothetical protein
MKTTSCKLSGRLSAACSAVLAVLVATPTAAAPVLPGASANLQVHYDFDHPDPSNAAFELDQGRSGTNGWLVNGGAPMRVADGAWAGSATSVQTGQFAGANNDWKVGVYNRPGVPTLSAFSNASAITVMGFVKPTGQNPSLNTNTANPNDYYNAVGLLGILSGNSNGHDVRALLEIIEVSGRLHLVALGRRVDGASSRTFAAQLPWEDLIPLNEWTHLAATFDFITGTMALYQNGAPLAGFYTASGNAWGSGTTSSALSSGIKIGGSYPANTSEMNPFNGRFDELMFFDRALSANEIAAQFALFAVPEPGTAALLLSGVGVLAWRRKRKAEDASGGAAGCDTDRTPHRPLAAISSRGVRLSRATDTRGSRRKRA